MSTTCWGRPVHRPEPGQAQGVRVAVLAGAGAALDVLRDGLTAAGAELVLVAEPQQLEPAALRDARPDAVLVALDAGIEAQLPRFDEVLLDDGVLVIYEDAELVVQRDAWENARWLRHVVAKLNHHGDVLPPRPAAPRRDLAVETADICIHRPASLEIDEPMATDDSGVRVALPGVVLVLAGMGGPDALRQLLAALPADFGRPVLVHQRLYGGRYDHLLRQLTRVSALPVQLAYEGDTANAGQVYVMPESTVARLDGGELRFAQGEDDFAGLPAAGSSVLLLSGCDAILAETAAAWARDGGASLVAQSPETCFDDAAARALLALGGDAVAPDALAQRLCAQA